MTTNVRSIEEKRRRRRLVWYKALGISILLGIGPMLSMVICWHFIVNRAKRVTWYRGLLAGLIASVLAYPLTAIVAAWILGFLSIGIEIQLPVLLGLSVLAALSASLCFPLFSDSLRASWASCWVLCLAGFRDTMR